MIGIFGDSYADPNPRHTYDREKEIMHWSYWLKEHFNTDIECHSMSGTPLWYSYLKFKETYQKYDRVVFTYTVYRRWNSLIDKYMSISFVRNEADVPFIHPDLQSVGKLLVDVFPLLYRDELNIFIYQHIFNEVNEICRQNNIKIVNLFPFENTTFYFPEGIGEVIDMSKAAGPCITGLLDISKLEVDNNKRLYKRLDTKEDLRHGHLNSYNNKIMSEIIFENFDNSNKIVVSKDNRFRYDEQYLLHALDQYD